MNNGHANAIFLLVDLLNGNDRHGTLKVTERHVVDALQLLADAAGKKLQTSRRPVEVRDAAVRLHELVQRDDPAAKMQHRVLGWDWRDQPDLDQLAEAVDVVSGHRAHLTKVETGGDGYVIVLANRPLDEFEARLLWEAAGDADA